MRHFFPADQAIQLEFTLTRERPIFIEYKLC